MSSELGTVQYEGNRQVFLGRDYGQTRSYSENIAYQIDSEVRKIMAEAHQKAYDIIEEHREQLNLIAEKLLEIETLDERTIKSLFETGQMPEVKADEGDEFPSEKSGSFEDMKRALEKKEAEKVKRDKEENEKGEDFASGGDTSESTEKDSPFSEFEQEDQEDELPPR